MISSTKEFQRIKKALPCRVLSSHVQHFAPTLQFTFNLDVAFRFSVVFFWSPVASKGNCDRDKDDAASSMIMIMHLRSKYW
jgi:hypothetical protein